MTGPELSRCDPAHVEATLARVSGLGPFFTIGLGAGSEWPTVADLYADQCAVAELIQRVADRLGTHEARVGASLLFQGWAGRLWSVTVGAAVTAGVVPRLPASRLRWRYDSGPVEFGLAEAGGWAGSGDEAGLARACRLEVIDAHLRPFAAALRRRTGLSQRVLSGNAASALVGAVHSLQVLAERPYDGARRPLRQTDGPGHEPAATVQAERAGRLAARLADLLLAEPPLAGSGMLRTVMAGGRSVSAFQRRSCCLYYRSARGGLCVDCVLDHVPVRRDVAGPARETC